VKREAGAKVLESRIFNAGAAPATVSDEPSPVPLGIPGKAAEGNDP
jgi:hypothetical protein